jgi:hypothetical protein
VYGLNNHAGDLTRRYLRESKWESEPSDDQYRVHGSSTDLDQDEWRRTAGLCWSGDPVWPLIPAELVFTAREAHHGHHEAQTGPHYAPRLRFTADVYGQGLLEDKCTEIYAVLSCEYVHPDSAFLPRKLRAFFAKTFQSRSRRYLLRFAEKRRSSIWQWSFQSK